MKRILMMSIREMYAILLIGAMLLFSLIYTSMALFQKSVEKVGIASIVASDINFNLTSTESNFNISGNSGTITVASGETKAFDITIANSMSNSTRYKIYYRFLNDVTILNVDVGISNNSNAPSTDIIEIGVSKTVRVIIKNNSTQSTTIEIGAQGGYASNTTITLNAGRNEMGTIDEEYKDESGANSPELADGMIPVIYNHTDDVWEVADTSTAWYDYNTQMWANAVTVNETASTCIDCTDTITKHNRTYYESNPGTPISMDDINAMWVWIPRYRYKISSGIGNGTSSNLIISPPQIEVEFITVDDNTNSVDEATYRTGIADDGTNINYYIHPAFRDIDNITYDSSTTSRGAWDEEITGFWVGKFETGTTNEICNSSSTTSDGKVNCKDVVPIIKPNVKALRYQTLNTQFLTALKFTNGEMNTTTGNVTFNIVLNNMYGLNTKSNTTDTHIMKNTEWGAVAILSQSQYGKMGNSLYTGVNKEIYKNNSNGYYTGRSSGLPPASDYTTYGTYSYNDYTCSTTDSTCTGTKTVNAGTGSSTTGTVYGIYDMNGGAYEYTMGNSNGSISGSGFTTLPIAKYYDSYVKTNEEYVIKEQAILGDATWETIYWYADGADTNLVSDENSWIYRGGIATSNEDSGVYYFYRTPTMAAPGYTFRTVLMP